MEHPALGADCIRALGAIGVVDPVVPLLDSRSPRLRRAAIEAVGVAGPIAGAAVPGLVRAVQGDDVDLSRAAVASIAAIGTIARPALPALERVAAIDGGPDATRGVEALRAIARVQAPPRPAAWDLAPEAPPRIRLRLDGDLTVEGAARARVEGETGFVPAATGQGLQLSAGATLTLVPDGPALTDGPGLTFELWLRLPWQFGVLVASDVFVLSSETWVSTMLVAETWFGPDLGAGACVFSHPSTNPEPTWLRLAIVRDAPRRRVEVRVDGLPRHRGDDFRVTSRPPRVTYVPEHLGTIVIHGPCAIADVVIHDYPRTPEQLAATGLSLERR